MEKEKSKKTSQLTRRLNNPNGWKNLTSHAVQRAWERKGAELKGAELRRIISDIEEGYATFVKKGYAGRKIYDVLFRGNIVRVVYNPRTKMIITFL